MAQKKSDKRAETNIKLRQIQEAIAKAKSNPRKEIQFLNTITDSQDSLMCEGCQ